MKKIAKFLLIVILVIAGILGLDVYNNFISPSSDHYIRDRVYLLRGENGLCTGIQVRAPSGRSYILSAAHCLGVFRSGVVKIYSEDNQLQIVGLVQVYRNEDLLLIDSPNNKGINIAKDLYQHEHVRAITHGGGHATYTSDGEVLEQEIVEANSGDIRTDQDAIDCKKDISFSVVPTILGTFCIHTYPLIMISAKVIPGSSGGPVVNDQGELVGIVSVADNNLFGGMVPLRTIIQILKDK